MLGRFIKSLVIPESHVDAYRAGYKAGLRSAHRPATDRELELVSTLRELREKGYLQCVTGFECGLCLPCRARRVMEGR